MGANPTPASSQFDFWVLFGNNGLVVRDNRGGHNRKFFNENFFKKWTPNMAYVLGFIYADGNLIHTKRGTWFWSLQITDKDILEEIKKALDSSHIVSKKKKHENQKQSFINRGEGKRKSKFTISA